MTVRKSGKDKEIAKLKRELDKANYDLAKKKEEKKERTIRLTEEQSRLLSELLGDTSITNS